MPSRTSRREFLRLSAAAVAGAALAACTQAPKASDDLSRTTLQPAQAATPTPQPEPLVRRLDLNPPTLKHFELVPDWQESKRIAGYLIAPTEDIMAQSLANRLIANAHGLDYSVDSRGQEGIEPAQADDQQSLLFRDPVLAAIRVFYHTNYLKYFQRIPAGKTLFVPILELCPDPDDIDAFFYQITPQTSLAVTHLNPDLLETWPTLDKNFFDQICCQLKPHIYQSADGTCYWVPDVAPQPIYPRSIFDPTSVVVMVPVNKETAARHVVLRDVPPAYDEQVIAAVIQQQSNSAQADRTRTQVTWLLNLMRIDTVRVTGIAAASTSHDVHLPEPAVTQEGQEFAQDIPDKTALQVAQVEPPAQVVISPPQEMPQPAPTATRKPLPDVNYQGDLFIYIAQGNDSIDTIIDQHYDLDQPSPAPTQAESMRVYLRYAISSLNNLDEQYSIQDGQALRLPAKYLKPALAPTATPPVPVVPTYQPTATPQPARIVMAAPTPTAMPTATVAPELPAETAAEPADLDISDPEVTSVEIKTQASYILSPDRDPDALAKWIDESLKPFLSDGGKVQVALPLEIAPTAPITATKERINVNFGITRLSFDVVVLDGVPAGTQFLNVTNYGLALVIDPTPEYVLGIPHVVAYIPKKDENSMIQLAYIFIPQEGNPRATSGQSMTVSRGRQTVSGDVFVIGFKEGRLGDLRTISHFYDLSIY